MCFEFKSSITLAVHQIYPYMTHSILNRKQTSFGNMELMEERQFSYEFSIWDGN